MRLASVSQRRVLINVYGRSGCSVPDLGHDVVEKHVA